MYQRNTNQESRKSNNPKLNFLEQTTLSVVQWQETELLATEKQKSTIKPLHLRFADLLCLAMEWIRNLDKSTDYDSRNN